MAPSAPLLSTVSGSTFTWSLITPMPSRLSSVGTQSGSGATIISPVITNSSNVIDDFARYNVTTTYTANGRTCSGSDTFIFKVRHRPTITTPSAFSICSGLNTNIVLRASDSNATFNWTTPVNHAVTVNGNLNNGTTCNLCNTISQVLRDTGINTASVVYTATASVNACAGAPYPITVTINPSPIITFPRPNTNFSVCSERPLNIPLLDTPGVGTTHFYWSHLPQSGISVFNAPFGTAIRDSVVNLSGSTTPNPVTYTVFDTSSLGCAATPVQFTVTVNPKPVLTTTSKSICSQDSVNLQLTATTGPGSNFTWTVLSASPGITGASAGGGILIGQPLTNQSFTATGAVTYSVIPFSPAPALCQGLAGNVTITVNPRPSVSASPRSQSICSGDTMTMVNFSSNFSDSKFNWSRDNIAAIGGINGSGSGPVTGIPENASAAVLTTKIIVAASKDGCFGAPDTVAVTIRPRPGSVINTPTQAICSGANIAPISFAGQIANTTLDWQRTDRTPLISGIDTSGSAAQIAGSLINAGDTAATISFRVTPQANGCTGLPVTAVVRVKPKPSVEIGNYQHVICSGLATLIPASSKTPATQFSWDVVRRAVDGKDSGVGALIVDTLTANRVQGFATFRITPKAEGCEGAPATATVIVNPRPDAVHFSDSSWRGCPGTRTQIRLQNNTPGSSFFWDIESANVSGAWGDSGVVIAQHLEHSGSDTGRVVYKIRPVYTGFGYSCEGPAVRDSVKVLPRNSIRLSSETGTDAQAICITTPIRTISYLLTGTGKDTVLGLPSSAISRSSGRLNIQFTAQNAGSFPYIIRLQDGCTRDSAAGKITVVNNSAITLSSAPGSNIQSLCAGAVLSPITYSISEASVDSIPGLPPGIGYSQVNNTLIIEGSPLTSDTPGIYNYTIWLTGRCGVKSLQRTGSIRLINAIELALTSASGTADQAVCVNTQIAPITYRVAGANTVTVTGLPDNVVRDTIQGNLITISGAPESVGRADYVIIASGGCSDSRVLRGSISAVEENNIKRLSPQNPTACVDVPVSPIRYRIDGAAGAVVSGLEGTGLRDTLVANELTITGTPLRAGKFTYRIDLIEACGNYAPVHETITISETPRLSIRSWTDTVFCSGTQFMPLAASTSQLAQYSWSVSPPGAQLTDSANALSAVSFPQPGIYTITLQAAAESGCVTKAEKQVRVFPGSGIVPRPILNKQPGNLLVYPDNSLDSYQWGADIFSWTESDRKATKLAEAPIPGAVYQTFTPAPESMTGGSSDTSYQAFWIEVRKGGCHTKIYFGNPFVRQRSAAPLPTANAPHISIVPNPNSGSFELRLEGNIYGNVRATVYNPLGQAVFHADFLKSEPTISRQIRLGDIPPGIYYIDLQSSDLKTLKTRLLIRH